MVAPRGFYRGYVEGGRRSNNVKRLHVMREDGKFGGRSGWCGIHGWNVTKSTTRIVEPLPFVPPDGLTWCGSCVLRLARAVLATEVG